VGGKRNSEGCVEEVSCTMLEVLSLTTGSGLAPGKTEELMVLSLSSKKARKIVFYAFE
jgi:hypothetical protein